MNRGRRASEPESALSRRSLRKDRRRAALMLVAFLAFAALTLLLLGRGGEPRDSGPSPLHYILLTTNVILLFGLSATLLRYFIRLLSERKAGILGSRFKLKLVATFTGLCLVPALVLYVVAIAIMFEALKRTTGPEVDAVVADAQAVTRQFFEGEQADLARELRQLGDALGHGALVTPEHRAQLRLRLARELAERQLTAARLHFRGRAEVLEVLQRPAVDSPLALEGVIASEFEDELSRIFAGEHLERLRQRGGELFVVAGAPVEVAGHEQPTAALFVARRVPADMRERAARLTSLGQLQARHAAQVPYLKWELALLFFSFSLVIIVGATWVGLYIARSITVPIQRLAEATGEVRRGNLAHVVSWEGNDELAVLVEAFNDMARDLKVKAEEVEAKASELRGANLALESANVELARQRDNVNQLLETMTAGVLALDADGRLVVANRAALQVLRRDGPAPVGRPFEEVLSGEPLRELRDAIAEALERPAARRSRDLVVLFDTGPAQLQVVLTSQPDGEGRPPGLLVLLEDVTELVRAQRLATWRAVARRVAHEIKNPLTPIQLSAQRILKKFRDGAPDLDRALESGVRTIVEEVRGLEQMVEEFSNFARMPEVRPHPGDLASLLESVAALYEGHERLELDVEIDDDFPRVPFDAELLRRAVVNLVDNAVEATDGKGHVVLAARLDPAGRLARLEVRDDGPGVPVADRERLFLPYFTTKPHGTGLGLSIVTRIVTDHGGRVRVEENEPRGARFVVELPLPAEPGRAASEVGPAARAAGAGRGSRGRGRRGGAA